MTSTATLAVRRSFPAFLLGCLLLLSHPARAQLPPGASAADAATAEAAEVLEAVDRLFDGMRARDADMLREAFHPQAVMVVAPPEGEDPAPVSVQSVQGFVESVGAGGEPFHEPYFDPEVRIDGNLANVWTFYHFYGGEEFSHCGYDSFDLVRTPEGWRIVFIAYSRRVDDCPIG